MRAPWWSFVFAQKWWKVSPVPALNNFEPWDGTESCWKVHGAPSMCPWKELSFQNIRNVKLTVDFHTWWDKNKGRSSSGCYYSPNLNRRWIFMLTDCPDFLLAIFAPNSVILAIITLLNIQIYFNHWRINLAECPPSWDSECSMICQVSCVYGCKFMPLLHLVRRGLDEFFENPTHESFTDGCLRRQFCCRATRILSQHFPRTFNHFLLLRLYVFCLDLFDCMFSLFSLIFLTTFHTVSRRI